MIEIDLLGSRGKPGSRTPKALAARGPGAARAWRGRRLRELRPDGWVLGSAAGAVAFLGWAAYMAVSASGMESRAVAALEQALADSVRRAESLMKVKTLEERRDAIAGRAAAIEALDAQRYAWPRIMSEVARALPAEAWLVHLGQTASGGPQRIRIEGMSTDNLAVARFWNGLEASPEIGTVQLVALEHGTEERPSGPVDVYHFVLEAVQTALEPPSEAPEPPTAGPEPPAVGTP